MENEVLEALTDIGYTGPLTDAAAFSKAIEGGPKSLTYTKLIHILAEDIKKLCNLEESINVMNIGESSTFLLELSSFLKELGCPYNNLTTGHMSSRLRTKEDKLLVIEYLISELMAARMVKVDSPVVISSDKKGESETARDLKNILITLKFNKPPVDITADFMFKSIDQRLTKNFEEQGKEKWTGKPLYNKPLSNQLWNDLERTFNNMKDEYRVRRETLITRLDCTVQSFEWSDRVKDKKGQIEAAYRPKRDLMKVEPNVSVSDFLAARTSLLNVEKSSSVSVRTNTVCEINKVIIGKVPDRGGRANEQQPPPPEMPSWQQRSQGGGAGGRGRGGPSGGNRGGSGGSRGGHGGGRVQGGYNSGDNRQPQNNRGYQTYEVPPGGYNPPNSGFSNQTQGYDAMGSYGEKSGYNSNPGYSSNSGYGSNSGYQTNDGYHQQNSGYQQSSGGYNNSGYNSKEYRNSNRDRGYSRGGYQNEHDDRTNDRRGRGGYQRGGRR